MLVGNLLFVWHQPKYQIKRSSASVCVFV